MPEGCCYCGCWYPPHGDGLHDADCPMVDDDFDPADDRDYDRENEYDDLTPFEPGYMPDLGDRI